MKKRAMVMGFVAVAMATAKPLPPQDVAEIRAWHTKLELPPVKDLPFVRVATGVSRVVAGEGERNTYLMAFLLKDHCGKDGQDFEVMTIDRHRLSFTRTKEGVKEADRRGYERTDWKVWLPAYFSAPKDDPDDIANLSSDRFTSIGPSTPATTLVNLAMYCDEVGFRPDAGRILERLSSSWSIEEGEGKPLMERLQHEFGHALIWQAMLACDDPVNPRRELQKNFERIVAECPKSRHVARAKEISGVLKRMIPEDDAHAAERAKVPFGKLSREDQIKDLIFQLRDQDGFQFSQPGSCSIFSFGGAGETPADRLVEFGFDAVPPLIEVLGDDRLTYSVGYHRNFYFSHEVLRVGDAAQQVIEKIGGVNLNQGIEVRMFGEDPKRYGEGGLRKAIQADARRWWEAFSAKGEKRFLIDEVSAGGESAPQLVDSSRRGIRRKCRRHSNWGSRTRRRNGSMRVLSTRWAEPVFREVRRSSGR